MSGESQTPIQVDSEGGKEPRFSTSIVLGLNTAERPNGIIGLPDPVLTGLYQLAKTRDVVESSMGLDYQPPLF
jgi:hypothetical protein